MYSRYCPTDRRNYGVGEEVGCRGARNKIKNVIFLFLKNNCAKDSTEHEGLIQTIVAREMITSATSWKGALLLADQIIR